jgi:hypothetical protein
MLMRTRLHGLILLFILPFLVALASPLSHAGTQNAILKGTIYSRTTGLVVPGATVRLLNANIGFSQMQTTDADGNYIFNDVPPAENYLIEVEISGFGVFVSPPVVVHVGDEMLVLPPIRLEPTVPSNPQAAPAPQASRPAPAPAPAVSLDLLSTTQSGVVDSRWVHTLPLVNRDFIDLALLVPGTYPVEQGSSLQGASLVVNGARADMNDFLLDGADNNDYTINQSLPFQIVEALQEFRVQASTSNAEFGRSGGAQVNSVSRGGSNSLHGTLFEFNRNSGLAAGNFFSAYSGGTFDYYAVELQHELMGNPLSDPTLASLYDQHKPRVNQNQFGGNLGGPLMKNKLFGFFNWESFRLANPRPLFEQVPGLTFRSVASCNNFLQEVASPLFPATCSTAGPALLNIYPQPNVPVTPFTDPNSFFNGSGAFNIGQSSNFTNTDNFLERVDWRLSSRTSMSFKHNLQRINQLQSGDVPPGQSYPGNGALVNGRNQNVSFNFVEQLTPRTTNEFRLGWNRFRLTTTAQDASLNPSALGFQNLNFDNQGLPEITAGGIFTTAQLSSLGSNFTTPSNRADNVWSFADNVSLNRGRHTWKFGGEFRYIRLNVDNDALARGLVTLFSAPEAAIFGTADIASIARVCPPGLPSFATVFAQPCAQYGNGFARHLRTQSFNAYIQDQWRPRSNLTFNYGIRYEVNTAPVELQNLLVNFYPALATPGGLGGLVRSGSKTIYDPFGDVIGTAPQAAPRAGFKTDFNDWGPRFGFAWNPLNDGKTVVRGGYALVFDQQSLQPTVNMLLNPPFVQQEYSFFPFPLLSDMFSACGPKSLANGCRSLSTTPGSSTAWYLLPYSITAVDPDNKTPYVHQYHLGVQQRLGDKGVIEVAYVGSSGHRLALLRAIDQCAAPDNPSSCLASNAAGQFQTPFQVPSILDQENGANSNFNSLQVRFESRSFHGLEVSGFYEYAKSIDDSSSLQAQIFLTSPTLAGFLVAVTSDNPDNFAGANNISPTLNLQGNLPLITTRPNLPQDSSNLAGERARSDFDIRHRFVLNYIYAVPSFAPVIGSGWQLAGITTAQSGQPFTVYADFFGQPLRPNVVGPVPINMSNPNGAIDNAIPAGFRPSAFSFAPTFQLQPGNLGRNFFTGPNLLNFDFAILKDTRISKREGTNLQFRVEFFNLFNNVNFRQPYSRTGLFYTDEPTSFSSLFPGLCQTTKFNNVTCFLSDPFFGQILQAFPARQIQLALKFSF